jgi:hypothetical protein
LALEGADCDPGLGTNKINKRDYQILNSAFDFGDIGTTSRGVI